MSIITTASHQWATRPADERFTSLYALGGYLRHVRDNSRAVVVPNKRLMFCDVPAAPGETYDPKALVVTGPNGHAYTPTHWAFGQLANLARFRAGDLRRLPAKLAAANLNYLFNFDRDVEEIGVLLRRPFEGGPQLPTLAAATGPNYGRIWSSELVDGLVRRFGDGTSGDWKVPGEFGKAVQVTKANTTLYASDRDMFVFLADETNRIEIPNRRHGQPGTLARGFYIGNSEVGASKLVLAAFMFDYACSNRTIWGSADFHQIDIKHTAGAPERFLSEVEPVLDDLHNQSTRTITETIKAAQAAKLSSKEDAVRKFLADLDFTGPQITGAIKAHMVEEDRPIESVWDATVGLTAYAKQIPFQDDRIDLERKAGKLLERIAVR